MSKRLTDIRILWMVILTALISFQGLSAAQPSAQSSLDKMVAAMKRHPSMDIVFTVWNNGNSSTGSMIVSGKNFHLSTPEMKVWYDGKTQWSYAPSAGEVNVTTPTADELTQTNPFSILASVSKNFTCRRLKAPAGKERIELIPKKKTSDFASAIVTLTASTSLPAEIVVKDAKGKSTIVKISKITGTKAKPASQFKFNPAAYPGVEIVDLR